LNFDTLLKELTEPKIVDNNVIQPNMAMRRAANVIKQLAELANADKQGRLEAERKLDLMEQWNAQLDLELRTRHLDTQQAFAAYQEVANIEFNRAFT
jgi:hypothetical protein